MPLFHFGRSLRPEVCDSVAEAASFHQGREELFVETTIFPRRSPLYVELAADKATAWALVAEMPKAFIKTKKPCATSSVATVTIRPKSNSPLGTETYRTRSTFPFLTW